MAEKRRRNLYANALDEAERLELKAAASMEGIDDEIALMRLQIKRLIKDEDIDALAKATNALCRLVATRYNISKHDKKGIKEALGNVLRDIALPLGIVASQKFLK